MNNARTLLTCACVALACSARAATYSDPIGDVFTGAGGGILDISSVEVNSTATDLIIKINLAGDPVATDWGKYMIALNTTAGGDTAGNGWGRPISMPAGMDYWVGAWADSGNGAEIRKFTGTWPVQSATYNPNPDNLSVSKNTSSVTVQFAFAGLGLAPGSSFVFDVFSSGGGGGDGAVDALSVATQSIGDWGNSFSSQSTLSFTIPQVPETNRVGIRRSRIVAAD
ncbi:MAG: hypothetical protein QM813_07170 [Verrucomicrobiota bacterium]